MTAQFSNPSHASTLLSRSSSGAQDNASDPHIVPDFNNKLEFPIPVLYLPPLLSSLPERFSGGDNIQLAIQDGPVVTETRLPDIDPASLSLHKALHNFRSVTPEYASVPYDEAFNWSELKLPEDEEREWYCVVFRSKRKTGSDGICASLKTLLFKTRSFISTFTALYEADKLAHEEAIRNGGVWTFLCCHPI